MTIKFYKCRHCGNVITKLVDSTVPVVCCGEKMTELVPNTSDGAGEKHVPVISVNGNVVDITISTVQHPSVPEHFIQFIVLETSNGFQIRNLSAGDTPKASFVIKEDEKVVAAYEYCNLHGLWKSEL
ncbi:MAG: desulfoferrodoxin family protein [Phocaeicola sp.]|uniref:desulfoferrodoxin family protein n=1 Tax=Phocaeicola TaxID=909656 RepID=UPI00234E78A5|nr:desulfoferrodoxin family protein [Phocaeicola oris]MCE2615509.1 desulfoferrodoxin [Phocaeicola oris]